MVSLENDVKVAAERKFVEEGARRIKYEGQQKVCDGADCGQEWAGLVQGVSLLCLS